MFYTYVLVGSLDRSIFYVGKGKGNRMFKHIEIAKGKTKARDKNPKLYNKISSIIKLGGYIIIEVIFESLNEQECLEKEIEK